KMLPAWVNEPPPGERYAQHQGQDRREDRGRDRRPRDKRGPDRKRPRPSFDRPSLKEKTAGPPQRHDRRPPRPQGRRHEDRHQRDRTAQRKFQQRRTLSIERNASRPDQSSRLSTAVAKSLRATFQPADEFRRLSAPNSDRDQSGGDREVEGRCAQSDHVF